MTRYRTIVADPPWDHSDGTSFAIPARVLEDRGRRVLVRYLHWSDGRLVDSLVRPHRIKARA